MSYIDLIVTDEDIRKGRSSYNRCPIANALRRQGGYRGLAVMDDCWYPDDDTRLPLSRAVRRFIADFDHGRSVEPSRFRVQVP